MDYRKLKSGSDVRGVAVGEGATLTPDVAKTLGMAFARYVAGKTGKPVERVSIALGRDSRVSGPQLLEAAAQGIASAGARAVDYGMCTTPAMYMAILTEGFQPDGSIMVTASHHPWQLNGLKFFTGEGGLGFHELDEVLEMAQRLEKEEPRPTGEIISTPFLPTYENHLKQLIISGGDCTWWWMRATARAASMPICWRIWAHGLRAASFWSRTAISPTISPIPKTRTPWPPSPPRSSAWMRTWA